MKTTEQIKSEIKSVLSEIRETETRTAKGKKLVNKLKIRLRFLRNMILYLETLPDIDYMRSELARIKNKIIHTDSYCPDLTTKQKTKFKKKQSYSLLKDHYNTLSYLLESNGK